MPGTKTSSCTKVLLSSHKRSQPAAKHCQHAIITNTGTCAGPSEESIGVKSYGIGGIQDVAARGGTVGVTAPHRGVDAVGTAGLLRILLGPSSWV